jgi:hypothetical protein
MDHDVRGRWANIVMADGSSCWIGIAQAGVLVKKSRMGSFGAKLYEEKTVYLRGSSERFPWFSEKGIFNERAGIAANRIDLGRGRILVLT